MHMPTTGGKGNDVVRILDGLLSARLVWSVVRWQIAVDDILLNGLTIFLFPVLELIAIAYCYMRTNRRLIMPYVLLPTAFHAYMIVRHCFSRDIMNHGASDIYTLMFCLVCLLPLSKDELLDRIYVFCTTMLCISLFSGLASYVKLLAAEHTLIIAQGIRYAGIFQNPNTFAHVVAYGFAFGVGSFLLRPENRSIWVLLCCDLVVLVKVLLDSQSRASMLFTALACAGIGIAFLVSWRRTLPRRQARAVLLLIVVAVLVMLVLCILFIASSHFRNAVLDVIRVPYNQGDSLSRVFESIVESFEGASRRDVLREITYMHWQDSPLFGTKASSIVEDFPERIDENTGSHNSFLQILATLGIVGLVLFAFMTAVSLICLAWTVCRSDDRRLRTIASFMSVMVAAMMVDSCYENLLYMSLAPMVMAWYFIITTAYQLKTAGTDENREAICRLTSRERTERK